MRIATLIAGLSLALATPALADNAATTYGPSGPLPSVLNPDEQRGMPVGQELMANDPRLDRLPSGAYNLEARSTARADAQLADPVIPTSGVTPGDAEGSMNVQASGATDSADVEGSAGLQGGADAESAFGASADTEGSVQ